MIGRGREKDRTHFLNNKKSSRINIVKQLVIHIFKTISEYTKNTVKYGPISATFNFYRAYYDVSHNAMANLRWNTYFTTKSDLTF